MIKKILIVIAVLATIFIAFSVFQTQETPEVELKEVKMGYMPGGAIHAGLPALVAQRKGFFEEEGFNVELIDVNPGIVVPALINREIDYSSLGGGVTAASLKGAPVSTIVIRVSHPGFQLIGQPGMKVDDIKVMGIAFYSTPAHYQALRVIEEYGLDAEIIASEQALVSMLVNGSVDAIVTQGFQSIRLAEQGFEDLGVFSEPLTPGGLAVRKEILNNDPDEVQRMVNAFKKATDYILNGDPDEIIDLMIEHLGVDRTEDNLRLAGIAYPLTAELLNTGNIPIREGSELAIQMSKAGGYTSLRDIRDQIVTQEEIDSALDFRFVE